MNLPGIQRGLDRHVLQYMAECPHWHDPTEWAFSLNAFVAEPWITKDMARAVCRSLTDRGYCVFRRGLFNEDGEVAGAGYGITQAGLAYLKTLCADWPQS